MAYKITEECVSCGSCEAVCKNEAVKADASTYRIDAGRCTECVGLFDAPKCSDICPVDACIPDRD
jgi:ferredoxin